MDKSSKYWMYQNAVQCVSADIDFTVRAFDEWFCRHPVTLREDFCGTALACCEWVSRAENHQAWGVDLDAEVLSWGAENNVKRLSCSQQQRLHLFNADVRYADVPPVDVVLAMNFSYYLFKTREALCNYFAAVRQSLNTEGLLILDAFGGHEAFQTLKESRPCDGFIYIWEQAEFDPVSHDLLCHIHFECDDGRKLSPAFSYHWRLWTLPEIRELLAEAGFSRTAVYWEGVDAKTGEGNGIYSRVEKGTPDPAWISYIVASV